MPETAKPNEPVKVFFSYSHKDEELRNELEKHLSVLKRQGIIKAWHDRRIGPGQEWKGKIDKHLSTAQVIFLFVSSDFLASDYSYDVEINRALERHNNGDALVIPIILRPVDWRDAPFGKLQALPTHGKPVTIWPNRDEAFLNVAKGIRAVLQQFAPGDRRASRPSFTLPQVATESMAGLPEIWNVPHRRNANFTGREELLDTLHKALTSGEHAALTQAIKGLGGVGKTQLALEYCYRHASDYELVWWVRSEEPASLAADYALLANKLDLPQKDEQDQRVITDAVRRWLEQNSIWLLVFDNVSKPHDVQDYLPRSATGHVIITSRYQVWGGMATPLSVEVMEELEAVDFLLKRTRQTDVETARKLAGTLGYLPLALEQAGAYMEQVSISLADYIERFDSRQQELLDQETPPADYPYTVATAWEMSFRAAQDQSPAGTDLLNLCSFFAPHDIPLDIIRQWAEILPGNLAKLLEDSLALDDAIAALRLYSLVEKTEKTISVHRLVQSLVRDRLSPDTKKELATAAVEIVNASFPFQSHDIETWPATSRLLPHALTVTLHAEVLEVAGDATIRLLNELGVYLRTKAHFSEAKAVFERAVGISKRVYGPDHPTVAVSVNNLGSVLKALGDLLGAKALYERALEIDKASYGPEHPKVAVRFNNLGSVLKNLGDLHSARKYFERALKVHEATYGPAHPQVANGLNNLGGLLQELGDLVEARKHYERALKIDETAYGPVHPKVATGVNNLGSILKALGDLAGARKHYERALKIDEAAYGSEHPDVATDINNLGSTLQSSGDLDGARKHFERALMIDERAYGPNHPMVARDLNNLGGVLRTIGDFPTAIEHYRRALRIYQKAYGPEHPTLAAPANNLAGVLLALGDLDRAKMYYEQAVAIDKAAFGPDHPALATDLNNLANVFAASGDLPKALKHCQTALKIFENSYGEHHPNTLTVKKNLQALEQKQREHT